MNKLIAIIFGLLSASAVAGDRGILMLDQTNNPVTDIQYGKYVYAFLLTDNRYVGLRRSTGLLEFITSPDLHVFRAGYPMRQLSSTGPHEDEIDLPSFNVVGSSGVGFAGLITTGIQENFTADGWTAATLNNSSTFNNRAFLTARGWTKSVTLPNINSTIQVGLWGLFSNSQTRLNSTTMNARAFYTFGGGVGGTPCTNQENCYQSYGSPAYNIVADGSRKVSGIILAREGVYSSTVPAFVPTSPLTYGTKRIRATIPAAKAKFRMRTVVNPIKASSFYLNCLSHAEPYLPQNPTAISNSNTEIVYSDNTNPAVATYSIGTRCSRTSPTKTTVMNTFFFDADLGYRIATTRALDDSRLFCGAQSELQMCHFLYGAPMYQASSDLRSVSYLWEGKFYLYDTLNPAPLASIALPSGVLPLKFYGYVGDV